MSTFAAASHEAIDVSNSSKLLHVNMTNVTKLTATNFLMWSHQVHALLDGYDLAGYLDGSIAAPAAQVTTNGVSTVNPAYTQWKRQDKLIYSAILGAINVSIQPILAKLSLFTGTALDNPSEYRLVLGSLQYLSFTRLDIAYSVNKLSQFMHRPTDLHWQAAKRILRYLAGTLSHDIYLRRESPTTLHAFSDADWAGDTDDCVSTNAYIVYLGSTPIAWSSNKQKALQGHHLAMQFCTSI